MRIAFLVVRFPVAAERPSPPQGPGMPDPAHDVRTSGGYLACARGAARRVSRDRGPDVRAPRALEQLDHPERRAPLTAAARAAVERGSDIDRLNDRLVAICETLAPRRPTETR